MIQKLLKYVGKYKRDSILTPIFTALEVLMETLLPVVIALLIDEGIEAANLSKVYQYGAVMIATAFCSLLFGVLAGKYAASASSGFAANLRGSMYRKIQTYSFPNIDRFSTAGLVTRMTTDVTNVQNAYQMCLRIAVRSPLVLIFSMVMCFVINRKLSLIFLAALVFLGVSLALITRATTAIFDKVFKKYDALNANVQENVSAIRVVKAFVREDYENKKFAKSADELYRGRLCQDNFLIFPKKDSRNAKRPPVLQQTRRSYVSSIPLPFMLS